MKNPLTTHLPAEPRILLITADQVMKALAIPALEGSGFRVSAASGFTEAIALATRSAPDVVLLELLVEGADALSLRTSLRELPHCSATPIFIMSDLFDPGLIAKVYNDAFSEFLPKPINWLVLPHRLRQAVVVSQSVAELSEFQEYLEQAQSAARSASTEALQLRNFDELTGLPNRSIFTEIISLAAAQSQNHHREVAVLFVDVDQFRHINDSLGRESGDDLLRAIAGRLKSVLQQRVTASVDATGGPQDSIARIQADKFAILLGQIEDCDESERAAEEILAAIMAPYSIAGRDVWVSASIGIAIASDSHGDTILQFAETAMKHAKRAGGKSVCVYTEAMKDEVIEKLELRDRLRSAIDNDEFRLHYQPLVDAQSGRLVGLEGLLRWTDPERGPISPEIFIPIAEESGLVVKIGEWVLSEALNQLRDWKAKGLAPIRLALNVARAQIEDATFVQKVESTVTESGIPPETLEFELSERGVLRNDPVTLERLRRLQEFGVTLAIDDFGTGQTTLAYLQSFPLSVLKIDRSFVSRIVEDPATESIIRAMIAMSHELDLRVVGEGVETEQQAAVLRALHCDELQGFLFYRALPADEIELLLVAQEAEEVEKVEPPSGTKQRNRLVRVPRVGERVDLDPFPQFKTAPADTSQSELFRLAHVDFLTDLLNRYAFERALETTLARAQRFGHKVALLVFDLDQFKEINDTYGHWAGDKVLETMARRMQRIVRQVDSLARLGGDEFALIHSEFETLDGVATLAQKLLTEIARPVTLGARELNISASSGIAVYPPGDPDPKKFYQQADLALYKAKKEGGARFHFHGHEMDRQVQLKLHLTRDLEQAIERDELHLVFQPQCLLATRAIVAVEALVRWNHPKRGLIPPRAFIPVAEDSGEIIRIGEWVLRRACAEARTWQTELGIEVPVSVNLSHVQFRQQDFPQVVERILEETGLRPELLELEFNQRVLLRLENDLETLTRSLHSLGVSLCIDDFGTSPFSIEDLTHLPFSKLKVDGRLIHAHREGGGCPPLVTAVIALGKKLNLGVVAEAVETQAQLTALQEEGCDFGQGNFFTQPMTAPELRVRLAAARDSPRSTDSQVLQFPPAN